MVTGKRRRSESDLIHGGTCLGDRTAVSALCSWAMGWGRGPEKSEAQTFGFGELGSARKAQPAKVKPSEL